MVWAAGQSGAAQGVSQESGSAQTLHSLSECQAPLFDIGVVPVEVMMTNPGWH